jgi:methylated-DNA-[protein]-cysteine S-methyltransferase
MKLYYQQTPLGNIGIAEKSGNICAVYFQSDTINEEYQLKNTPLIEQAFIELQQYFSGTRQQFTVPLLAQGTVFRQTVWQSLLTIPYGKTISYKQLAQMINKPKACQAVGQANGKNPIPIFIPCHRVIGIKGDLIGYSSGLAIKQYLLDLEARHS